MTEMDYFEGKKILEDKIEEYNKTAGKELAPFNVDKQGHLTIVSYGISSGADMYAVVDLMVKKLYQNVVVTEGSGDLRISYSNGTIDINTKSDKYRYIRFMKSDGFDETELDAILDSYRLGNMKSLKSPEERLNELGIKIYKPGENMTWDYIAGYDDIKKDIHETIILPLQNPAVYQDIIAGTRKFHESIRPKAVLFEGPPGTGKTTMARVISRQIDNPLVYVPLQKVIIKWVGESERNMEAIFDACTDLGNSILFIDEIDTLANSQDGDNTKVNEKVLSVLLQKIDGFEPNDRTLVIGATNRKDVIGKRLIDRMDVSLYFRLPRLDERASIFQNYAKQLNDSELKKLAEESDDFSGRNIKDLCEDCERRWAFRYINKEEQNILPNFDAYMKALKSRMKTNDMTSNGLEKRRTIGFGTPESLEQKMSS